MEAKSEKAKRQRGEGVCECEYEEGSERCCICVYDPIQLNRPNLTLTPHLLKHHFARRPFLDDPRDPVGLLALVVKQLLGWGCQVESGEEHDAADGRAVRVGVLARLDG